MFLCVLLSVSTFFQYYCLLNLFYFICIIVCCFVNKFVYLSYCLLLSFQICSSVLLSAVLLTHLFFSVIVCYSPFKLFNLFHCLFMFVYMSYCLFISFLCSFSTLLYCFSFYIFCFSLFLSESFFCSFLYVY